MGKDSDSFFDGIEDVDAYDGGESGRAPIVGLGKYLVEIVGMSVKKSPKIQKTYAEITFKIEESSNDAHPAGTEGCVQIWHAKFNYHQKKFKALVEAAYPSKKVTQKFCDQLLAEDLLSGARLRITVTKNSGGYPEPAYSAE